jgi:putative transposase
LSTHDLISLCRARRLIIAIPEKDQSLAQTLACTHCRYSRELNRILNHSGHLWQNRYFSCPLDYAQLNNVLRYVDLNPIRAGLVAAACDWRWSSAPIHCGKRPGDPTLAPAWRLDLRGWDADEWQEILCATQSEEKRTEVQRATLTGRPVGSITSGATNGV